MIKFISKPSVIKAAGNKSKEILEYIGHINSGTEELSIAHMKSPQGWEEPAQTPEFNEYTLVLSGTLIVSTDDKEIELKEGQAIIVGKGEKVMYSTPFMNGAEYIAICLPAFSPQLVNREKQ